MGMAANAKFSLVASLAALTSSLRSPFLSCGVDDLAPDIE